MKWTIVIGMFMLLSCSQQKQTLPQLLEEWQGKRIVFPADPVFTRYGKDTVDFKITQSPYAVLFYVDSSSCVSCKLKLDEWKSFRHEVDSLGGEVQYLFFIHNRRYKYVRNILKSESFDWPVCLDADNTLDKLNHFPADEQLHAFLLDRDKQVLVVGDPMRNLEIRNLYLKRILGIKNEKICVQTIAKVDRPLVDVGTIDSGVPYRAVFNIRNTGNKPLVITNIITSCGCMKYEYDKEPAPPGGELSCVLIYSPAHIGAFSESVLVHCNTERPMKLTLEGIVKTN